MQETFGAVGVSERVVAALRKRGLTAPFRIQTARPEGRHRRPRRAREVAHRLRQDARVRDSDRRAARAERPHAGRARARADPRARPPGRPTSSRPLAHARGLRVAEVYGGVGIDLQARRAANAHCIVATPGRLEDLMARKLIRLDASRSSSSTRPTGCSTSASSPPSTASSRCCRASVRRCSSRPRSTASSRSTRERSTRDPLRVEAELPIEMIGDVSHQFIGVERDDKLEALVTLLANPERDLALVFVRTKRGAARLARRLEQRGLRAGALHGDMSQSQRTALAQELRDGPRRHAGRDRRRRPRPRRRRDHPRDQLRSARRRGRLHASRRAHGSRRPQRHGHHVRAAGRARGHHQARRRGRARNRARPRRPAPAQVPPEPQRRPSRWRPPPPASGSRIDVTEEARSRTRRRASCGSPSSEATEPL